MAVDGQREGWGVVAELLLDILQGLAAFDQQARKRVPERVGLAVAEPRSAEHRRLGLL